jgi:plasmid maintenance system antidote protein VapI
MIMDREKLTAGAFAESIGVAQATISHILGPRNKYPSTEVILRLHQRYTDINLEWLLTILILQEAVNSTILYLLRIRKI